MENQRVLRDFMENRGDRLLPAALPDDTPLSVRAATLTGATDPRISIDGPLNLNGFR